MEEAQEAEEVCGRSTVSASILSKVLSLATVRRAAIIDQTAQGPARMAVA